MFAHADTQSRKQATSVLKYFDVANVGSGRATRLAYMAEECERRVIQQGTLRCATVLVVGCLISAVFFYSATTAGA